MIVIVVGMSSNSAANTASPRIFLFLVVIFPSYDSFLHSSFHSHVIVAIFVAVTLAVIAVMTILAAAAVIVTVVIGVVAVDILTVIRAMTVIVVLLVHDGSRYVATVGEQTGAEHEVE